MNQAEKRLPRGHAYMHFRTNGCSIHVDFPEKHVEWLEEIILKAMEKFNAEEAAFEQAQQEPRP